MYSNMKNLLCRLGLHDWENVISSVFYRYETYIGIPYSSEFYNRVCLRCGKFNGLADSERSVVHRKASRSKKAEQLANRDHESY